MRIYGLWEKLTSLKLLKNSKTITLEHKETTPSQDVVVQIPEFAGPHDMVLHDTAQVLTNKTIDSDSNTITNIVDADIKSSAAITHSKLANITAGNVLLGNASNVPTSTPLSGDITVNSTGVTAISSSVIIDADISASAAIDRSKLASGTADHVIINNGAGTLVSEAQLNRTRGGTGISSTATFPASGTVATDSNILTLTNKTVLDNSFVIADADDTAKQARFTISSGAGVSLFTLPDAGGALVSQSGAFTLTNKILSDSSTYIADTDNSVRRVNLLVDATQVTTTKTVTLPKDDSTIATLDLTETLTNKTLSAPIITTSATFANQAGAKFREQTGNGTNEITVQAPASLTADYTLTLPPDDGTAGQALTTDGSGVLTWSSVATDALNEQHIKVGNAGTAAAVDTAAVGDILADDTGGLTIKSGVIVNADVNASAAIEGSKLQAASGSNAGVVTTGAQTFAGVKTLTSDLTIATTGVDANIYVNAPSGKTAIMRFSRDGGATLDSTIGDPSNFITGSTAGDFGIDVKGSGRKLIFGNNGTNSGEMNSSGAWTFGASGGTQTHRINGLVETTDGVKLKNTGAGSTLLNHYETGTTTLSFYGTDFTSITYTANTLNYTRIGNVVYVRGIIQVNTVSGSGGVAQQVIEGLPYTPSLECAFTINYSNITSVAASGWTMVIRLLTGNGTKIFPYPQNTAAVTPSNSAIVAGTTYIFTGFYFV